MRLLTGTVFKMLIIFGIAHLLDVFWPTFYCAVTYGFVKIISGGMHYRSFGRSILLSIMLFITMGVVADTFNYVYKPFDDVLTEGSYTYVKVLFEFSLWCAILFVPVKVKHRIKGWNLLRYVYKIATIIFIRYAMDYSEKILNIDTLSGVLSVWTAVAFGLAAAIPFVFYGVTKLNQILNYR
ncbi:MAG: accessory gene regulator B family protein [Firmicutes bacterium]|nr:accessory gene regulator B family protein [Bacillota bacterium]